MSTCNADLYTRTGGRLSTKFPQRLSYQQANDGFSTQYPTRGYGKYKEITDECDVVETSKITAPRIATLKIHDTVTLEKCRNAAITISGNGTPLQILFIKKK